METMANFITYTAAGLANTPPALPPQTNKSSFKIEASKVEFIIEV